MSKAKSLSKGAGHSDPNQLGRDFKKRLRRGDRMVGAMVFEYLRPSLVKIFRRAGFDFIFIEKEHGIFDSRELPDFVLSARDNRVPVISKIGSLNRSEVTRLIVSGIVGIQLPRTESRDQLLELAQYMKFPPLGTRAGAPCFGNVDYSWASDYDVGGRRWQKGANEATCIVAQIETAKGYENAEAIITTPGVDMVYVGPYDFSISMGRPGEYDHPDVAGPMKEILALCLKHGVPFGTTASGPKAAAKWIAAGCQFFDAVDELSLIDAGARQTMAQYGQMFAKRAPRSRK